MHSDTSIAIIIMKKMSRKEQSTPTRLEGWQSIPGYGSDYLIDPSGQVLSQKNKKSKRILSEHLGSNGRPHVSLFSEGERRFVPVANLMALVQNIPNPDSLNYVLQLDNDFRNYSPENLVWCSLGQRKLNDGILKDSSYIGVYKKPTGVNRWFSSVVFNYQLLGLGFHKSAADAARAYNQFVIENRLERALNVINDHDVQIEDKHEKSCEEWKDVHGTQGSYQVSNLGRIKSVELYLCDRGNRKPQKILKASPNKSGDLVCALGRRKKIRVAQEVARSFGLKKARPTDVLRYKDGDKANCELSNLEFRNKGGALIDGELYHGICKTDSLKNPYSVKFYAEGQPFYLGSFETLKEAIKIYNRFVVDHKLDKPLN